MIKKIFLGCFVLFYLNTTAHSIEFFGKFTEGGIIKGKASPNSELFLDKKKIKISKNGYFIFGIKNNIIYIYTEICIRILMMMNMFLRCVYVIINNMYGRV
jgi:hypothetical protein